MALTVARVREIIDESINGLKLDMKFCVGCSRETLCVTTKKGGQICVTCGNKHVVE